MTVVKTTHKQGVYREYTFYVITSDGGKLKIPHFIESFDYFVDVVNRAATHLPYAWSYVDLQTARSQGKEQGWYRLARKQA